MPLAVHHIPFPGFPSRSWANGKGNFPSQTKWGNSRRGGNENSSGTGRDSGKAPGFPSHSHSRGYTILFYSIKLEIRYLLR